MALVFDTSTTFDTSRTFDDIPTVVLIAVTPTASGLIGMSSPATVLIAVAVALTATGKRRRLITLTGYVEPG